MPREMQTSLNGGELSPSLHSHADLQKYGTGLATLENWFVLAQGGIRTRAGLEFVCEVEDSADETRLIPFQFNTEQAYPLVLGDQTMRVIRNGGVVLEASKAVSGATQANPVVVTTATHGYSNGDDIYISGIVGMTELNGRFFRVANVTATTFELTDTDGNNIDGTGYTAYSSGGTAEKVYQIATPWAKADLFRLKYTQSADTMTVTHPTYQQREITRTDHDAWSIAALSFAAGISPPSAGLSVTQVGTASGSANKTYRYVVTSVGADGNESVASAVQSSGAVNALNETYGNEISWNTVSGASYYNVYKEFHLNSGIFGWIGEADEDGSPVFTDFNLGPDMTITPPIANNPFNAADSYPSCVTYHQGRQMFGATNDNPQTIWGSRSADFDNMDYSRPLQSDDSIEATIAARQVNEIRHMVSLGDLVIFTSGGEWLAAADQNGVLTPANINFKSQSFRGSNHVAPLVIGETALYIQEKGSRVRDLRYTFEDDKYRGDDLSILARHMFEGFTIVDWAYAQEPYSVIWAVRDDGVLLSMSYLREHQVYAWARHTTDGEFESVCTVSEGNEDVVYVIVKRTINGVTKRFVERMHERLFTSVEDAFCVDCGLTFTAATKTITAATQANPVVVTSAGHNLSDGDAIRIYDVGGMTELNGMQYRVNNVTANTFELQTMTYQDVDGSAYTAYTSGGTAQVATTSITNLHHLEGEAVVALADGNAVMDLTVSGGAVTLPNPASVVHIGLGYNCDFKTLEASLSGPAGISQSRKKQIARVVLRVLEARGLAAGTSFDDLYEFPERTVADGYDDIAALTQEQRVEVTPGWDDHGQFCCRQAYPLPATVLALIPEVVLD